MPPDHVSQRRDCASEHILQALATRDRRPMRRPVPGVECLGPFASDLVGGQPLPLAVIDVDQTRNRGGGQAQRPSDRFRGRSASAEKTGVEGGGGPARLDATRGRLRLPAAFLGQLQIGAAAKPFGRNAFDVAVPNKNNLGHALVLSMPMGWGYLGTIIPQGATAMPADPNRIILTGENPFIRLSANDG